MAIAVLPSSVVCYRYRSRSGVDWPLPALALAEILVAFHRLSDDVRSGGDAFAGSLNAKEARGTYVARAGGLRPARYGRSGGQHDGPHRLFANCSPRILYELSELFANFSGNIR